jgi:hypothetical protein
MHVIIWEFRVQAGREEEFERAYGPAGGWARLEHEAPIGSFTSVS